MRRASPNWAHWLQGDYHQPHSNVKVFKHGSYLVTAPDGEVRYIAINIAFIDGRLIPGMIARKNSELIVFTCLNKSKTYMSLDAYGFPKMLDEPID